MLTMEDLKKTWGASIVAWKVKYHLQCPTTSIPYSEFQFQSQLLCFRSSLLLLHLGRQQNMVLGCLPPCGRPGQSSQLMGSARPRPGCCSHLWISPHPISLSPSLSDVLPFKEINKCGEGERLGPRIQHQYKDKKNTVKQVSSSCLCLVSTNLSSLLLLPDL